MGSETETWLSVYNYKDLNYIPVLMQWWDSHVSITLELCGMKEIWREVLTQRHKAENDRWFQTSCFSFQMHIHASISHTIFHTCKHLTYIYITHENISHTYITYTWRITHTYISHKHGGLLTRAWWRVTYRRLTHTYHIHGGLLTRAWWRPQHR